MRNVPCFVWWLSAVKLRLEAHWKKLVLVLIGAWAKEWTVGVDFLMQPVRAFLNPVGGFGTLELLRPVLGRLLAAWLGNWAGEWIVGIEVSLHFTCAFEHPVVHFHSSCSPGSP